MSVALWGGGLLNLSRFYKRERFNLAEVLQKG